MSDLTFQWLVTTLDASVKALLLALIAFAAIYLLRLRDSNLRHRLWVGVLLGMLLLPVVSPLMPALYFPRTSETVSVDAPTEIQATNPSDRITAKAIPPDGTQTDVAHGMLMPGPESGALPLDHRSFAMAAPLTDTITASSDRPERAASVAAVEPPAATLSLGQRVRGAMPDLRGPASWFCVGWLVGLIPLILRLAFGMLAAARMVRRSTPITTEELTAIGLEATVFNAGSVFVYECPCLRVPVTCGIVRTRILLPPAWISWSDEKLQSVLAHEAAHARRRDASITVLAEINRAIYWFHPLAWWLKRQLADLAESACDDEAINLSGDRTNYARHLLEVAAQVSAGQGRLVPLGVSMARRSNVETRIDAILDFTRPLSTRLSRTSALCIYLAAVALIGLFAAMKPNAQAEEKPAQPEPAVVGAEEQPESAVERNLSFTFSGTVVDGDGQPVEGAEIRLTYWRIDPLSPDPPPLAITDSNGRFGFTRAVDDYSNAGQADPWKFARLVATKKGYGFTIAYSVHAETSGALLGQLTAAEITRMEAESLGKSFTMKMVDDAPVRGRLLDTQGNPVAGATISPITISEGKSGSLDEWEESTSERGANFYSARRHLTQLVNGNFVSGPRVTVVPAVRTDDKGRFTLAGLGKDRMAEVLIGGPGIESTKVFVRSRAGTIISLPRSERGSDLGQETYYPDEFSHVAGPSQPVVGRVVDAKTGEPVAGVVLIGHKVATNPIHGALSAGFIRSTSDDQGRFRLDGFPIGENKFLILPSPESGYLMGGMRINTTSDGGELVRQIELTKGIMLRGRVTDGVTGKPVRGHVDYWPLSSNPFLSHAPSYRDADTRHIYFCDSDGRFELPVMPGQGILTLNADQHQRYKRGAGADAITFPSEQLGTEVYKTQPSYCIPTNHHFLAPLDIKTGEQPAPLDIKLGSGASFTGQVVAADGTPVTGYHILGSNHYSAWYPHDDATFTVNGYFPRDGRSLMAYHPDTDTVAALEVKGEAPESVVLKLVPAGRLSGRVVDEDGLPIAGGIISSAPPHMRGGHALPPGSIIHRLDGRPLLTGDDGRFEIRGLMPGRSYAAILSTVGMGANRTINRLEGVVFDGVSVNEGETKDLGDITAQPYQQNTNDVREQAKASERSAPQQADPANPAPASKSEVAAEAAQQDSRRVTGQVLDEAGQPVADAKLFSTDLLNWPISSMNDIRVKEIGRTRLDGRFDIRMPAIPDVPLHLNDELYVHKDGYGVNWIKLKEGDSSPQRAVLIKESPVSGVILNTEGEPISGAEISVKLLARPKVDKTIEDLIAAWKNEWNIALMNTMDMAHARLTMLTTKSDAKGRFTIHGIPSQWATAIDVSSSGHARTSFYVFNQHGIDSQALNQAARSRMMRMNVPTIMGPQITHVCEPEFVVRGRVVDEQGKPLGNISVRAQVGYNSVQVARTDNAGNYRLGGLRRGRESLVSFHGTGQNSDILDRTVAVTSSATAAEETLNMMLRRGIVVTGTLSESDGVPVPRGGIRFVPLAENDFSRQPGYDGYKRSRMSQSIHNGKFRLVVIPGPGVLLVQASGVNRTGQDRVAYQRVTLTEEQKRKLAVTGTGRDQRFTAAGNSLEFLRLHHAIACVDFAEGSGPHEVQISVSRGTSLEVDIVDPDGKPVDDVFISGITENWPLTAQLKEATCTIQGLNRVRPRKVLFLQAERNLAGSATLTGDEPTPVTVKLGPSATIRGRAIDPSGEPLAGTEIQINFFREYASELYRFYGEDLVKTTTDADGHFVIHDVLPGERFNLDGRLNGDTIRAQAKRELIKQLGLDPETSVRRLVAPSGGDQDFGDLLFGPPFGNTLPWPR